VVGQSIDPRRLRHDARSPLAAIRMAASALRGDLGAVGPAERAELLRTVELAAEELDRLVTNLCDLDDLLSGAVSANPTPVAIDWLVAEALRTLTVASEAAPIEVELGDAELVRCDGDLTARGLANCCFVAIERQGGFGPVKVSATAAATEVLVEIRGTDATSVWLPHRAVLADETASAAFSAQGLAFESAGLEGPTRYLLTLPAVSGEVPR